MNHLAPDRRDPPLPHVPVAAEHFDVLIVGAGISGIGSAWRLSKSLPDLKYAVLEAQESFGGTWLTHRYPGIRSDSDLHTFGFAFKPWVGPPIATAQEIRSYLDEVIKESGLDRHIRYRHRILSAEWSSEDSLWTLSVDCGDGAGPRLFTCNFLWMCQGYYRHDQGYTPEWKGMEDFKGEIIHPQTWPEGKDLSGKKVVVIGSGATAATLVPALAGKCAHVTMLQRSPTYFRTGRNAIEIAEELRRLEVDEAWIHEITRRKVLYDQDAFTRACQERPDAVRKEMLDNLRAILGPDFDVDRHFGPSYRPWRQRIAFVPDADLFEAVKRGEASVVTDEIDRFAPEGILLKSGEMLEADVIVTATGFTLSVMGDIPFTVDGAPVDWSQTVTYRGMMFTGVPNLVWVFGYFRASWTLRTDLVADFMARLLPHMAARGATQVGVALRPEDAGMEIQPWIDPEDFNPGYLMRDLHRMPRSGTKRDWRHTQDYWREKDEFPAIDLDDAAFVYR
ncbi:MAG: NAD(P)/FAD-dependent oxidoreductase [Pseudomonadota bacterium]|nr:NAD(P)/FAD-dependent oxidoreductase [Pseudomonadota bacterium]